MGAANPSATTAAGATAGDGRQEGRRKEPASDGADGMDRPRRARAEPTKDEGADASSSTDGAPLLGRVNGTTEERARAVGVDARDVGADVPSAAASVLAAMRAVAPAGGGRDGGRWGRGEGVGCDAGAPARAAPLLSPLAAAL